MINIHHRHDRDYISLTHLLHRKSIINLDYLFEDHGWQWRNFNDQAYRRSASHFTAVATRMTDAKAVTFTDPVGDELTRALKASSSMPIIAKSQRTSQGLCMDGGVADSIPYDIAQQQGFKKIVIVRTRDINYRKKPTSRALAQLLHRYYPEYPTFVKAAINRPLLITSRSKRSTASPRKSSSSPLPRSTRSRSAGSRAIPRSWLSCTKQGNRK